MSRTVALRSLVEDARSRIVGFAELLLRTPSLSGHEEQVAQLVQSEMQALGYTWTRVDEAGNVIGRLAGGDGRTTLLHAHMDVVDPGEASRWRYGPFSGQMAEECLWGRGASDTKGSLVAQVYAVGLLREAGLRPAGDVYVSAVVMEETAGLGTRHLLRWLRPDLAVIGEPSGNTLRRGHRGRLELVVTVRGRSAHASAPDQGLNPHFSMARFLLELLQMPMAPDPVFGSSSVTPTLAYVDQTSSNVIPAEVTVHLDWRAVPGETADDARGRLLEILDRTIEPGIQVAVSIRERSLRTYTGLEEILDLNMPGFCLEADDARLLSAQAILEHALGRPVAVDVWTFSTDGGSLSAAGIPCIGFGPGEEEMAHVIDERIDIDQLLEATVGYMALALEMGRQN